MWRTATKNKANRHVCGELPQSMWRISNALKAFNKLKISIYLVLSTASEVMTSVRFGFCDAATRATQFVGATNFMQPLDRVGWGWGGFCDAGTRAMHT